MERHYLTMIGADATGFVCRWSCSQCGREEITTWTPEGSNIEVITEGDDVEHWYRQSLSTSPMLFSVK